MMLFNGRGVLACGIGSGYAGRELSDWGRFVGVFGVGVGCFSTWWRWDSILLSGTHRSCDRICGNLQSASC